MAERSALLMRAISEELSARIIPELRSPDAIERANLARLILRDLAADLDVLPGVAADLASAFRSTLSATLASLPAGACGAQVDSWRETLTALPSQSGAGAEREIGALRALAAALARALSDAARDAPSSGSGTDTEAALRQLGSIDCRWLTAYATAASAPPPAGSAAARAHTAASTPAEGASVTVQSLTTYLRRAFPDTPQIAATEVIPIPGGRSKKTFFVAISDSGALPSRAVIRQDYALKYEGTKVRDEYTPLAKLAAKGLPVPRPWHLEPAESEVGPPFMIVERLQGSAPGTYFGLQKPCPGAFRDMARMLAALHRMPPAELGFAAEAATGNNLEALIDRYERKWRDNATRASPLIDYAYAWARREARREPAAPVVVHGDAGPYNFLIENDRLTAVLDWEFAHLGDPAEDIGIVRVYAEDLIDWQEFLALYAAAGGPPVAEHRVRLAMVLQFLKGTTLVAASGRNFEEGWTREFIKGASSFTGLRLIELRIAQLLERFQAL
jgi:aminoglycoside phosphotransferase (APT) family kinase protein